MKRSAERLQTCERCLEMPLLRCALCFPDDPDETTSGFSEIGEAQDVLAGEYVSEKPS